jgi:hypothetical protein
VLRYKHTPRGSHLASYVRTQAYPHKTTGRFGFRLNQDVIVMENADYRVVWVNTLNEGVRSVDGPAPEGILRDPAACRTKALAID